MHLFVLASLCAGGPHLCPNRTWRSPACSPKSQSACPDPAAEQGQTHTHPARAQGRVLEQAGSHAQAVAHRIIDLGAKEHTQKRNIYTSTHHRHCALTHTRGCCPPPPPGTAGARQAVGQLQTHRVTSNAGKNPRAHTGASGLPRPCHCILICRPWPGEQVQSHIYISASAKAVTRRRTHTSRYNRGTSGFSGLPRPDCRAQAQKCVCQCSPSEDPHLCPNRAQRSPARCSTKHRVGRSGLPTVTGEAHRPTRTLGRIAGAPTVTLPPGSTTHCRPCMPGPAQRAPTPMPQRPGPVRVDAFAGRRKGGTPGFHTHAQLQQACHRLTHRRQRAAHCRLARLRPADGQACAHGHKPADWGTVRHPQVRIHRPVHAPAELTACSHD